VSARPARLVVAGIYVSVVIAGVSEPVWPLLLGGAAIGTWLLIRVVDGHGGRQ
jgi:hypothetical protein